MEQAPVNLREENLGLDCVSCCGGRAFLGFHSDADLQVHLFSLRGSWGMLFGTQRGGVAGWFCCCWLSKPSPFLHQGVGQHWFPLCPVLAPASH